MAVNPDVTLQPHQQRIADAAHQAAESGDPFRLLAYHQLGSGKTLTGLGASHALGSPYTAVVPASLRPNFRGEEEKFTDRSPKSDVISYNAVARGKDPGHPTVVVDEAARMLSPSPQADAVRRMAERARNVILLTGTPIVNKPEELAHVVNVLTGKAMSPDEFRDRYVETTSRRPGGFVGWLRGLPKVEDTNIANADELKALLRGKVDYYAPEKPPVPVKYEDVEAELTPRQADLYRGLWEKVPLLTRVKLMYNYGLGSDEMARLRAFMTGPRQSALSDLPYQKNPDPLKAFDNSGKLRKAFELMQEKLKDERAKGIVYSNYVDAGLRPYSAALTRANVPHAMFHGGLSDAERKKLVDDFNANKLRVALVGPSGSEGISLRGAQTMQVLDEHWTDAKTRQAMGRGLRFDSHSHLPEELRAMTIQRFKAILPPTIRQRLLGAVGVDNTKDLETVDHYLRDVSDRKARVNQQFLDLLKEVGSARRS